MVAPPDAARRLQRTIQLWDSDRRRDGDGRPHIDLDDRKLHFARPVGSGKAGEGAQVTAAHMRAYARIVGAYSRIFANVDTDERK